ncbi:YqaA family protein [Croceicoccus naphthovorans]|uniref:Cytochrome B561 n=1 Tax=Croceicoccus naphthovorans TaxID=1348774 RepID=A0A0G3XDM4_9SPHN|nr:YqaA family protein [Croceicoccus naphthovorans]AKM09292.1 cytochrome B561 [Croceicoccus naphthovorans]MBB3990193.1 membrane protein YqaA with SNARE-associated domain [Croceicoccus naphthovorans]
MLRKLYDWTMEKAQHRHAERWLAGISFVESSFFPIPPHPLLGLMCLANPKKAVRYALITTIASVLGGLFGYAIGYFLYDTIGQWLIGALGLQEAFPKAACYLREFDVEVILVAGSTPVPFKLLTITAGFIHMALVPFILASIAGRGLIFMTVGILFRLFGAPIKSFIDRYLGLVTTAFILLVVAGFVVLTFLGGHGDEAKSACDLATTVAAA